MTVELAPPRRPHDATPKAATADLALRREIERALQDTRYQELADIRIQVGNGAVTLFGRLPSYYLVQIALTTVQSVDGVSQLRHAINIA